MSGWRCRTFQFRRAAPLVLSRGDSGLSCPDFHVYIFTFMRYCSIAWDFSTQGISKAGPECQKMSTARQRLLGHSPDFSSNHGFMFKSDELWGSKCLIRIPFNLPPFSACSFPFQISCAAFLTFLIPQSRAEVSGVRIWGAALPWFPTM